MRRILVHLDTDPLPSVFDRVAAIDAGVDELFSYGDVTPERVEPLVHGALFTRSPNDLKNTAVFIGGSRVEAGEGLLARVAGVFFGPMRVSVMMDSNGSNTTAAAAVLAAKKHLDLRGCSALVLGGTGPVGQRAAQLLAQEGARVRLASRSRDRAAQAAGAIQIAVPAADVAAVEWAGADEIRDASRGVELLIAAGTAGAALLSASDREAITTLQVAIDLNAVPPSGLAGIAATDKAAERNGVVCYGAIGVGRTKMKIHKACVAKLFESNDQVLDTETIYRIGEALAAK